MTVKPSLISGLLILALAGMVSYQTIYLRLRQQLSGFEQELKHIQQTQALRTQLAASMSEVEQFRQRLPSELETGWLIRTIGSLAQDAGIQLTTIMPQLPKPLQEFTYLAVNLQFTASYRDLTKFLTLMEHGKAFIRIDDVDLSRTPQETAQVKLVVSTLYVPALIVAASPEAPLQVPVPNAPQPQQPVAPEGRVRP